MEKQINEDTKGLVHARTGGRTHFFDPDSLLHCAGLSTKHWKKERFLAPKKLWHDSSAIIQLWTGSNQCFATTEWIRL